MDLMRRRNVLQNIGASSASMTVLGATNVQASNKGRDNEAVTRELSGGAREQVLDDVKNDEGVRKLVDEVDSDDWSPQWDDATVDRTKIIGEGESEKYDVVILEFEKRTDVKEEMFLVWMGNNTIDTREFGPILHHVETSDAISAQGTSQSYDQSRAYTINEGEISVDSSDFYPDTSRASDVHASSHRYCEIDICIVPEDDLSITCVARVIANMGVTGLGCLGATIAWPAIIACIGGLGITADQIVQCTGGYNACQTVETNEVERQWLEDLAAQPEENPCSYFSSSNDRVYPMTEEYFENEAPTRY